jgi:type II secretory pathway pseudopilin PulG
MRAGKRRHQGGFSYVVVLTMVAVMGIGLAAMGPMWAEESRRQREDELLRVGRIYAAAIASYHQASPGSAKRYPPSLDVLLSDTRFVGTKRHLRALYPDPVAVGQPWGLIRAADGGIRGVFSMSEAMPLRRTHIDVGAVTLPPAARYSEWQFVAKVED